ncbi:acyl transferase [Flavobacterium branchiophilum]|uniref:Probable acyl-protein synthetase n=1 Tax=Flavobacterium branchiophilum (strain FL-15) TaxID=1034807 RepID=G2Z340_FLABF|nr:acyltransferase [Flavobacterium branchiophilum]CCB70386.1 Probable acyl-protein synthetase [Flavobacterium branchiophilum FL-15]
MIPSDAIFNIKNQKQFEKIALQVFRYQYEHNVVYREFCNHLKINVLEIKSVRKIPFLPISFFKTHQIISGSKSIEQVFTSSGTTGATTSSHFVSDVAMYEKSYRYAFTQFYGNIQDYTILALLPSYLERTGSSLIYMVADLIAQSNNPDSGFYLKDHNKLVSKIQELEKQGKNTLLIGVTFGLLDVLDQYQLELHNTIVMETGGMKGRRKELIREELHGILCKGFGVSGIHSEYGMTELLSQAYSFGHGVFECPAWMQVLVRDTEDALSYVPNGKTGGINVIDLANIHSCSFIATQDLGKRYDNGTFEVLGRFDHSDIRGCNLMVL